LLAHEWLRQSARLRDDIAAVALALLPRHR
jgi:hypothetical protein